ncbi:MAG TPA: FAD-binding oxidoreductase, partial [Anaerolineae bacterium]|nr:FAD-binding oxidoreductase [Anaerolineae bacterium]
MLTQLLSFKVKDVDVNETKIEEFKNRLTGQLIRPGDAAYDEARRVWNGLIDKYPALIARVANEADVIEAVNFARQHNLLLSVRGGGHNAAGHATNDGGIVIDLSFMKGIQVDPQVRTVRAQGGVTWGELDQETQKFGLATPGGVVSTTGIAGLTLGGGIGWLRRKHGLSSDNLLSVDVVTADGRFLKASETENADLFWAIRGSGGNFGVVTSFEYRLHPVGPEVMVLVVMYPAEKALEVLPVWRNFMAAAPDAFSSNAYFWTIPAAPILPPEVHGKRIIGFTGLYAGPVDEGERLVQPLRELAAPVLDLSGVTPYTTVQSQVDAFFPAGLYHYWKSLYLNQLDDETINTLANWAIERPSEHTMIDIWAMGGVSSRIPAEATTLGEQSAPFWRAMGGTEDWVAANETAFGHRNSPFWLVFNTSWTDPQDTD